MTKQGQHERQSSASGERWRNAKQARMRLAGGYGRPVHPMLITIPIGAWLASLVFDIASRVGGPSQVLYIGSYWLIAIGLIGAVMAAIVGFLDLIQIPAGSHALRVGLVHMGLNLTVVTLYVGNLLLRLVWPVEGGVPFGLVMLSAASFVMLSFSGHLGGKLAYRYGVRVADESAQRDAYDTEDRNAP